MGGVRFFYYDGKAIQGPLEVAELIKQAGFSSESVVCPAGSQRSDDWKPAVNYDELREALLKPKPEAPPVKCPGCGRSNPGDALFCNKCGGRMDGKASPLSGGPMSGGPRPGGMGRIGQTEGGFSTPLPPTQAVPSPIIADLVTKPAIPDPQSAKPGTGSQTATSPRRRALLAAAAACVLAGGSVSGYILYKNKARHPAAPEGPAASPDDSPAPAPSSAPAIQEPTPQTAPPPVPSPRKRGRRKTSPAPEGQAAAPAPAPAPRPKRGRKAPGLMDVPTKDAESPPVEVALPGMPKKVRAKRVPREAPADLGEGTAVPELSRPSGAPPTSESLMIESAQEQFSFCHQLMRQGEFGDVFESCLCPAAREASPYKGRKGVFVEQAAEDPQTEAGSSMETVGSKFVDGNVLITGRWTLAEGSVVERTERWAMEENRWCLAH